MSLTKKRALELSKKLWKWCAKTGLPKHEWPEWEKYGVVTCECFLCEYGTSLISSGDSDCMCNYCPLFNNDTEGCYDTAYTDWEFAKTEATRKKFASLFLEQLRSL